MSIAILGWGSLIWCPGSLQMKSCWHRDGPTLPVEFARISYDTRLTLVIHPGSVDQRTLWATAVSEDLDAVRQDLGGREGADSRVIHSATAGGQVSDGVSSQVREAIAGWLRDHRELAGCVWTGLASNWSEKQGSDTSRIRPSRFKQQCERLLASSWAGAMPFCLPPCLPPIS